MSNENKRPTIAELEQILSQPTGNPIEVQPNGEVRVADDRAIGCAQATEVKSSGQLQLQLRRELLDAASRAVGNNQTDIACQLIAAYECLMRAGM